MARVVVIRIVVDNKQAINDIRAQREEQRRLNEQIAANARENRNAEAHAARMARTTQELSHVQQGLTNSFIKGNLAARAISATYISIRDSVRFAIGESAKYELTMARVSAVTGSSRAQTQALSDTVFQLSRNVAANTNEIGETALELAKLGFSGETLKGVLGGVAQLSSTLGDSLEATGQLVGGVINAFNLSTEEAVKVSDKLFVATGRSATNIEGFKVAFSLASAVAEDAGIKFEEFAAAVAALSNQGIRASTIGTGLRNFIAELSKEGSKAQKALGGSIEELGLLGAIERLQSLKLPAGSLIELFGKPGSPVASGLQNARDQYLGFLEDIKGSEGALLKAGSTINETLVANVTMFKNAMVEASSFMLTSFAPAINSTLQGITSGVSKFNDESRLMRDFKNFKTEAGSLEKANVALDLKPDESEFRTFDAFRRRQESERSKLGDPGVDAEMSALRRLRSELKSEEQNTGKDVASRIRDSKDMLADFERLKTDFEVFQTFGGEFDFSKTIKEMEGLAQALLKIGERQDAVKVMQEIVSIEKSQKKDASEASKFFSNYKNSVSPLSPEEEKQRADSVDRRNKNAEKFGKIFEDSTRKTLKSESEGIAKADKFNLFVKDLEASIEPTQVLIDNLTLSMYALGDSTELFGDLIVNSFLGHEDAFSNFQDAFGNLAKSFISDLIAMGIRILAFKALLKIFGVTTLGFGGGLALGFGEGLGQGIAGGITAAANGYDGVVNSPRLFLAGEGGEPERVKITPLSKMGDEGGNVTIIVQGDVFDSEKLVDKIALTNERSRSRYV